MKSKPTKKSLRAEPDFATLVGRALKRAGKRAREVARMHGTKVYFIRNGKIVAEKP
jgi:hypothetical protein